MAIETRQYNILALDDHPMVLEGIKHIVGGCDGQLNLTCVTHTSQMLAELDKSDSQQRENLFDMFILDLELPDADGFEAIAAIRRHCPAAAILIYTMHEEPWILARLARLDIQGVVSKDHPVAVLTEAVETIRHGGTYFDETFMKILGTQLSPNDQVAATKGPAFLLSDREQQVLRAIADGLSTHDIAQRLFISENTVGTYRRRLMTKFEAHNVAQLIGKARRFLE